MKNSLAPDRPANGFSFVAAKIVRDHEVARGKRRCQHLLDIGFEAFAVDRTVEHLGRLDAIMPKGGHKGQGFPVAVRNAGNDAQGGQDRFRMKIVSDYSEVPPTKRRLAYKFEAAGTARRSSKANGLYKTKDPIVVQLIGTRDNVASPLDQVDIAVDGHDPSSEPQDRRYFFVEMANTDHEHAGSFPIHPMVTIAEIFSSRRSGLERDGEDCIACAGRRSGVKSAVGIRVRTPNHEGAKRKLGADERRAATDRELAREDAR